MSVTTLRTVPPFYEMATTEKRLLPFDTSVLLAEGQSPSDPSATLVNVADGETVGLTGGPPSISGNIVSVPMLGSDMEAANRYELSMTFTADDDTIWTMVLTINVPQ